MISFDPVLFSVEENKFIHANVGQPPVVVMRNVPTGVNRMAIKPVIDKVYELVELEKHAGAEWCGVEPIKATIEAYLTQLEKWELAAERGAPNLPSMYTFDSRGRAHRYGPGSDSGRVRTYFGPDGKRIPFAVELIPMMVEGWTPGWTAADMPSAGLIVDTEKARMECPICNHTESFNKESRGSFNAARARMSRHLRNATDETMAHRELHTKEFS